MRRAPLSVVLREWARIGITSFGGPPAQVALLRELCVERRGWLTAQEFEDANAATQLLPGPGGTQLAIYCAQRVGGRVGGVLGGLAFMLPGLVIMLGIAAIALGESPPLWIRAVGAGAAAAVVAVVVQAGLALGRTSVRGRAGGRVPGHRRGRGGVSRTGSRRRAAGVRVRRARLAPGVRARVAGGGGRRRCAACGLPGRR